MTDITIFSCDAEKIQQVCEDNDIYPRDIIEALMEHLEEVKDEEGWI